jgi:hypothetical protein
MVVPGSIILVEGNIQSSLHEKAHGETTYSTWADEIRVLEDEEVGFFRHEFYLASEIVDVKEFKNKVVLLTKVRYNNRLSYVPVSLPRKKVEYLGDLKRFKYFTGCGTIQTGNYIDADGVRRFYEEYRAHSWKIE